MRWGFLYVGRYGRQLLALLGMDPDFLNEGISQWGVPIYLWGVAFLTLIAFGLYMSRYVLSYLRRTTFYSSNVGWIFLVLCTGPVILANGAEIFFEFRPLPYLFSYSHAIAILLIAVCMCSLIEKKSIVIMGSLLMLIFYGGRYFSLYEPAYDNKGAYVFLMNHVKSREVVMSVRLTNHYLWKGSLPNIDLKDGLERDEITGHYKAISLSAQNKLREITNSYECIWFYKTAGNDELFGGNELVMEWLDQNGYEVSDVHKFKRIDLIYYKKRI